LRLDSIRSKMLVFALLATLIPSVTTGWISYLQNERSLSAKITGELQGVSAQTAREVDLWVKERLYELRVFASSYEVSENLHRLLRRFAGGGEQSGQVYLITAGGRPIVGSRSDPTELMRRSLPAAVVRRMLDQEGTTREYRGLEGEEVVGTMKAVPRLDWAVLAEVPASEAFRQVTRLRNVTVLIVAALLVAVGLFAYFLGLLITRPLDRLTRAAAQVASGDLDVHLPVVGGDEFVVLMPETRAAGAIETAQRIRTRLATDELVGGKLSVSIGVSQFPDDGDAPEALLARADAALYRAKREGRDRVLRAPPPPTA